LAFYAVEETIMKSASKGSGQLAKNKRVYRPVVDALKNVFGDRLKTIVLFGSQARGTSRPGSDHDLFVVITDLPPDPLKRHWLVRGSLLPKLDRLPGSVAIVAKTPEELEANLTPLLLDICFEGTCLYGQRFFEPYRARAVEALRQSGLRRERVGGTLMWVFSRFPVGDWELGWEGYREISR
jgi:predicted nucleotidyltransferase